MLGWFSNWRGIAFVPNQLIAIDDGIKERSERFYHRRRMGIGVDMIVNIPAMGCDDAVKRVNKPKRDGRSNELQQRGHRVETNDERLIAGNFSKSPIDRQAKSREILGSTDRCDGERLGWLLYADRIRSLREVLIIDGHDLKLESHLLWAVFLKGCKPGRR